MNNLVRILICCVLLFSFYACDDNDQNSTSNIVEVALGSKEFKTLENITPLQIPVVLTMPAQQKVTIIGYVKSETNAIEGTDYTFVSKEIEIAIGKSIAYFEVLITDYPEYTPDRSFEFEIVGVEGATLTSLDVCKVTIFSDEGLPRLGFEETLKTTPEELNDFEIKIGINKVWDKNVPFQIKVLKEKSSAVFDEHYKLDTTKVYSIAVGDTTLSIPIQILDDTKDHDDRYFELMIIANDESVLSEVYARMKITIRDDEEPIFVCFDKLSVRGLESDGSVWIPVRVKGNTRLPVKVKLGLRNGSAFEGEHYSFTTRELLFENGKKLDSVRIDIIDNNIQDIDRHFTIGIDSIEGASLLSTDTLIEVNILNDDFNLTEVYDKLMGEWTLTNKGGGSGAKECNVTITGGDTPAEEDKNYLKYLVVKMNKLDGSRDYTCRFSYDAITGDLAVVMGDTVGGPIQFQEAGIIIFDRGSATALDPVNIEASKDYRTLSWDPSVGVVGAIYRVKDGSRWAPWFTLKEVVMTRKE